MKTLYSEKVCERIFVSTGNPKETYMEACKWLATNIYSKPGISNYLSVKILKQENKNKTKVRFVVEVWVTIDESDVQSRYCDKCKQLHTIFYSIEKVNCEICKLHGYKEKLYKEISELKKSFEKEFGNGKGDN